MTSAQHAVRAAFEALPDSHRQVLVLARSGYKYSEIADMIGVAPSMVSRWAMHGMLSIEQAISPGAAGLTDQSSRPSRYSP